MGIRGLVNYVHCHCLEDYQLGDTDLIIDGSNLIYFLYSNCANCNDLFGGDYDAYSQTVSDFFDGLLKVNTKPIVFLHGSYKKSKIPTVIKRKRDKICFVSRTSLHTKTRVNPLFLTNVFVNVLRAKNISHARCCFDVDSTIAAVAKALNCPVLTSASEYYLYDVSTIPVETLTSNMFAFDKKPFNDSRKTIDCKIYRLEILLNGFKGLNQHKFSLTSVILSNDYLERDYFKDLNHRNARNIILITRRRQYFESKSNVFETTANWLCNLTLEEAITEILTTLPASKVQDTIKDIETRVNKYTNPSAEIFTHLSIPEESFEDPTKELYKYRGDISTLPYNIGIRKLRDHEQYNMDITGILLEGKYCRNDSMIDRLPYWLKYEFSMAKHVSSIINIVRYNSDIIPVQWEPLDRPTSAFPGFEILRTIFGLLNSIVPDERKSNFLNVLIRNQDNDFIVFQLKEIVTVPLLTLREISDSERKNIIDNVLGIKNMQFITEVSPEWQLYIASIKYWTDQAQCQLPLRNGCIYSLLLCMLYKSTVSKFGYYNSFSSFTGSEPDLISTLMKRRQSDNIERNGYRYVTFANVCKEIDTSDCISAAPFFIAKSLSQLTVDARNCNMSIQHAFAQFQYCLSNAMCLNALLNFPYEEPNVANLYNGTLLYNLCATFCDQTDIRAFINVSFDKSPTLLRAYNVLLSEMKPLFF